MSVDIKLKKKVKENIKSEKKKKKKYAIWIK